MFLQPAYQNLQNRVEGSVNSFLRSQTWKPDLNKNQLRETLRKHIHDAAFLEVGVERIVDQVVNPKIYSVFRPQIEDVVYKFLGLERPRPREKNGPCALKDLLPKDLDPISPESDRNSLKDESLESIDMNDQHLNGRREILSESKSQFANEDMKAVEDIKKEEGTKIENVKIEDLIKYDEIKVEVTETMEETEEMKNGQDLDENSMEFEKPLTNTASTSNLNISFKSDDKTEEEEESPQFEPIDIMNLNESNLSNDSHLSGISELTSHRSRSPDYSNEFSRDHFDLSNHDQDSQLSKVSSNSRLSIVTDFGSSNQASSHFPIANEDSKDKSRDNFRAIRDVEEGKYKERKFNFESIKNKSSSQEKDLKSLKSFSSRENSRDEADSLKEKNESKDGKDRNESFKSKIPKNKTESRDSRRHRDRDRKKQSSSSSSRHSKSSTNDRDQSRDGSEKTKLKEEKPKEKEEKRVKDERKEKDDRKEKDEKKDLEKKDPEKKDPEKKDSEKKDAEKQEILQDIFKDLKDIYKEKIRELREKKELTEKEKLNKDSKTKDSKEKRDSSRDKKEHKKDHRTSKSSDRHEKSSRKSNESKDKDRKRDDHRTSKESKSRSSRSEKEPRAKREGKSERSESRKDTKSESQSKEKKQREEKKKTKDDHSSLRKNSNDRRSTDRDGSNGSNSKSSQKTTSTGKSTTTLTKETNKTNSGGDTSDGIEDSQGNNSKLATSEFKTQEPRTNSSSGDIQHVCPENSSKTDNLNSDTNALNEAVLPLKKRPFPEDSSSLSPSSSAEKVKKPKFAKNFHEARKLMKIRRRMEKQNSDQDEVKVNKSEVEKFKVEVTVNGSLSNSPLPEEDITKVPDEERVQIIQVLDEECEEPYSEEMPSLTLEETSMIILEGQVLGQSQQKESKLSLMERSIRQSLDEMMSDQKLAESAERNIERETPTNLREDASQIENVSSEKDIETVKKTCILSENDKKGDISSDEKSLEDEADENLNLEKLEKGDGKFKDIPEGEESVEFLNQQGTNVESEEKEDPQNKNFNEAPSPKMELRVSMGIKKSTEDLMRHLQIENSLSSEKFSQEISKKSNRSPDKEKVVENNLEVTKVVLSKNKEHTEDDEEYKEKDYRALSPVEEDCLYLEPDNERAWRFARFLESFEKKLNLDQEMKSFGENPKEKSERKSMAPPQLKRKLSSSPLSDILLQNANNNNDGIKEGETEAHHEKEEHGLKRRKLGRPKKQRPSLSSFNPPGLLNGENFVMPLSPESDVSASSEKTSGQPIKEEKR